MPEKKEQTPAESEVRSVWGTVEEADKRGFYGANTDATPDDNYTLSGVTSGAETPETVEPGSKGSTKRPPAGSGEGARTESKEPAKE